MTWARLTLAVVLASAVLEACTGGSGTTLPTASASVMIRLEAPFGNGQRIPDQHTCRGADRPLEIRWSGATGQGSLVLVMTDRDAGGFVHWLVYNFAGASGVLGDAKRDGTEGRNSFGGIGYRGPCPPPGDPLHHYVITMYQFPIVPSPMTAGESADDLLHQGNPIAEGSITGVYAIGQETT
jgi:Raf kinase inhibitor-like YbhB/YbcL family protein